MKFVQNDHAKSRPAVVSRRQFLAQSAVTTAACAVGARAWPAPADPWTMRLSTSSIHYTSLPIEQACERIAALGFEAIDIWSPHAGCPHLDDAKDRLGPDGLKEVLERNRLKPYAWSVYSGGFRKYADFIGAMGGGVAVRGSTRPSPPEDMPARMKEFVEALEPELELAEKHDVCLAIENHGNALLDSLDSLKAFVDVNRNPRLGIALAPYHLQQKKTPVEDAIRICGEQLLFFYAWQAQPGTMQLPGIGPTDVTPWLAALAEIKYRWYVNPFMHGEPEPDAMTAALRTSREYLLDRVQHVQDR
ncbi:MAG: sugar phosphate isomerase/epimerase [Thermoguttaceae bacterium]|jgi:sugar phosphate isomerase/epimerase|nr:sugar phosphate isomerase/epimerase [Thermoguttaceae bacterium]